MIPFCDCPHELDIGIWCHGCSHCFQLLAEMRRYLYRNCACEARKTIALEKHMPDVRGWT